MEKIERLKEVVAELPNKSHFANKVAKKHNRKTTYVLQEWLQKSWRIPSDVVDDVIEMAEKSFKKDQDRRDKILNA